MNNTQLKTIYNRLKDERRNLDGTLDVVRKFFVPFRGEFFEGDKSESSIDWRALRQVFDSTGIVAADRLASNVQSALTNMAYKWYKFKFRQAKLNEDQPARVWLDQCEDIVFQALKDSNFETEASELYLDAVSFGTAVISEEAKSELEWEGIDFSAIPLNDCYFEDDVKGKLLRFFRKFEWTPLQIKEKFGVIPKEIEDKVDAANTEKMEVVLCVYKIDANRDADVTKVLAPNKRPFEYRYILTKTAETLGSVGGYYEMPSYVVRWRKVSGSKWGYSPAHVALSDVLTANQLTSDTLEALAKVIDPAILTTSRALLSDLDLRRSGVTVVRDVKDVVPFESKARFDVGELKIDRLQSAIRSAFYVDQLELKESPAMTAAEVYARADMVLKLMGPTSGRFQNDFLDPCLERTFRILMRAGQLPDMPESVKAAEPELDIEYTGPLARAQRQDLVGSINNWMMTLLQQAEVNPAVLDIPDWDKIARETGDLSGVPAKLTKDQKEVDKVREARAEQQEQERMLAMAQQGGEAMTKLGQGAKELGGIENVGQ